MKTLFLSLLSLVGLTLRSEKLGPDYQIIKSESSKMLSINESVFAITFFDPNGKPVTTKISASDNSKTQSLAPNKAGKVLLKVKPGKHIFQFFVNTGCDEIYTDSIQIKPAYITEINVYFRKANSAIIVDKPVIYVYGKQNQKVSIHLDLKGEFTFTYPNYANGWNFNASPDGTIDMNDHKYHYLFWDGKLNFETSELNLNEGFVVEKSKLTTFFEEHLKTMGLNSQEMDDFITYWCPRMSANEFNYIHFLFNADYNKYASINISPKPDQLFRVCMLWSKANTINTSQLKAQKIETFKRNGFTVVEWGGSELKNLLPITNP